jgi:predicted nucleotidyltransferase
MDAREIELAIESLKPQIAQLGVDKLLLVGSGARGELRPDSDLDFVVEFQGPATFVAYMDLIELLETATGRSVDLTTMKALRPELVSNILAGARQVA